MSSLSEIQAAAQQTKEAQPQQSAEVRLPVVDKTPSVSKVVVYDDGHKVVVPKARLLDHLKAEEYFGKPFHEIQNFTQTECYIYYLALFRHKEEKEWPVEEYEDWLTLIDDIEFVMPLPDTQNAMPEAQGAQEGTDDNPLSETLPEDASVSLPEKQPGV